MVESVLSSLVVSNWSYENNGCSLILQQLPSRFLGSFSRRYRNGHINTIDLIFTIEHFLLSNIMHFFTSLNLLHLLLLTFSIKSIKLPLI